MRKLFLFAFSPLIIGSLWLMTYYGIKSNNTDEKVFAVAVITAFVIWLRLKLQKRHVHAL